MHADTQTAAADKHALWEQKLREMDVLRDTVGTGIDPGIRETVAVLQLLGVHTRQSCEGHMDHGIAAPWVDLESADPRVLVFRRVYAALGKKADTREDAGREPVAIYEKMHAVSNAINQIEAVAYKKLMPYLEEFYHGRTVSCEQRLLIDHRGRLTCQGALLQPAEAKEAQAVRLHVYQQEMRAFTEFLKRKFFS